MATTAAGESTTSPTLEIVSTAGSGGGGGTTKIVQLNIGLPTTTLLDTAQVSAVKRHELLARQPSYCKILNDLKEVDPSSETPASETREKKAVTTSSTTPTPTMKNEVIDIPETTEVRQAPTVVINGQPYQIVTPTGSTEGLEGVISINSTGTSGSQFSNASVFLPSASSGTVNHQAEEQARKREIRLLKNREAARECRNKKKEYIKCLENRVAVLENQNKALIEELKLLKELYKSQN